MMTGNLFDGLYDVYDYDSPDLESADFQGSPHQTLTILFKTGICEFNPDGSHSFKVDKKMLADLINYRYQ